MAHICEISSSARKASAFPVPYSIDEYRKALTDVFLHYVRNIAWMTDERTAWAITGLPATLRNSRLDILDPKVHDVGLKYEHIQDTRFASCLECMYDYAFFGRIGKDSEAFEWGSIYTWLTALVYDASEGTMSMEWSLRSAGSSSIFNSIQCCMHVAETANARVVLEGGKAFFPLDWSGRRVVYPGLLTYHQLALLSGMEDSSIRSAATRKHRNALQTTRTERGPRIKAAVAKAWLLAKGRYIPVT